MRKLRIIGIIFSILLILYGIEGFAYIIHIGGASPEASWKYAAGPAIVGIFMLTVLAKTKKGRKNKYVKKSSWLRDSSILAKRRP